MPDSEFTFDRGAPIFVGDHGDNEFVYEGDEPVRDSGESPVVFEAGNGIGGIIAEIYEDFEDQSDSIWGQDGKIESSISTPDGTYYRETTDSFDQTSISRGEYSAFSWWQRVEWTNRDRYHLSWGHISGFEVLDVYGIEQDGSDMVWGGTGGTVAYTDDYSEEWVLMEMSEIDYSNNEYTGTVWDSDGNLISENTGLEHWQSHGNAVGLMIMHTAMDQTAQIDLIQSAPASPP